MLIHSFGLHLFHVKHWGRLSVNHQAWLLRNIPAPNALLTSVNGA